MPDAPGLELIAARIGERHPGAVLGTVHAHGSATLLADPEQIVPVLTYLRDAPEQRYRRLASLHGADYLPGEPRFAVHYELLCMERVERVNVKALLPDPGDDALPEIDSVVSLYPTAEFQEREVYDFFGIVFRGHPDLRRILMPEDYVGWPQRRDFPVGGDPVIFTNTEDTVPGWVR